MSDPILGATNLAGSGSGLFQAIDGGMNLLFKTVNAGSNLTLGDDGTTVTFGLKSGAAAADLGFTPLGPSSSLNGANLITGSVPLTAIAGSGFLTSASPLNGANLIAGSVADTALASIFLKSSSALNGANLTAGSVGAGALAAGVAVSNLGFTPVNPTRQVLTQQSLTGGGNLSADRTLNLVGDVTTPSADTFYGYHSSARGWFTPPSATATVAGYVPTPPNDVTQFFRGDATWGASLPPGIILPYGAATAPSGWLLCDGSAVSRTTYAALFAIISTTWGVGDGSTTFNVPDFRGRAPIGAGTGSGLTNRVLGTTGGEENHQLIIAELAVHTHVQNAHGHSDSGHNHTTQLYERTDVTIGGGSGVANINPTGTSSPVTSSTGFAAISNATATNQNTGSGTTHNNMQPWAAATYIIKT